MRIASSDQYPNSWGISLLETLSLEQCVAKRLGPAQKETNLMAMRNANLLLFNLFYHYFLLALS